MFLTVVHHAVTFPRKGIKVFLSKALRGIHSTRLLGPEAHIPAWLKCPWDISSVPLLPFFFFFEVKEIVSSCMRAFGVCCLKTRKHCGIVVRYHNCVYKKKAYMLHWNLLSSCCK